MVNRITLSLRSYQAWRNPRFNTDLAFDRPLRSLSAWHLRSQPSTLPLAIEISHETDITRMYGEDNYELGNLSPNPRVPIQRLVYFNGLRAMILKDYLSVFKINYRILRTARVNSRLDTMDCRCSGQYECAFNFYSSLHPGSLPK